MSFSTDIREEILEAFSKKKDLYLIKAERFGEYLTEAIYKSDLMDDFKDFFDISNLSEDEIKAVIKGVFLASGCIVDPNSDYRYEASFKNKSCAEYYIDLLSLLDFTPKLTKREKAGIYIVYFKESEQISYMLGLLEANRNMLYFENIRVEKDVSNSKNRVKNCDLANSAKAINSAREQIEAIKVIRNNNKFSKLNEKLKYTAILREENPTASLDEISKRTEGKNKISKSGLKHRLDKLIQIAKEIEESK